MSPELTAGGADETPGLVYFGKMTAALSHELKNCLAIINENSGLIEDLTAMARNGRPLDPDRMEDVTGRISRQVVRADDLLKQMNKFGHSVDQPVQQIDLNEAVRLASALGAKPAANRMVKILPDLSEEPVQVRVPFFHLLNLIWQTIEASMTVMDPNTTLGVKVCRDQGAVRICFTSSAPFTDAVEPGLDACGVYDLGSKIPATLVVLGKNQVDLVVEAEIC